MAIEPSALRNVNDINKFVLNKYDITKSEVIKIDRGSANCYKVYTDMGILFLKEFQKK